MKFRNYCIVVLGDTKEVKEEINTLSESEVRYIDAKGVFLATFMSVSTPSELKSYLENNERNFFLFELGVDNYSANLVDDELHEHLFKDIEDEGQLISDEMTKDLIRTINIQISGETMEDVIEKREEIETLEIEKMSEKQRNELLNDMLDKGAENWDDNDKIIVDKLTKK